MAVNIDEILALSAPERIDIMDAIWMSLADENAAIPLSEEEILELKRRHEEYLKHPERARPWDEVRRELLRRNRRTS